MFKSNEFYDWKVIRQTIFTIVVVFAAMKFTRGFGFAIVIPFTLMALFQNRVEKLLFWIMFANMLVVTNNFFAPKNIVFAAGYRGLLTGVGLYGILLFFSVKSSKLVLPLLGIFAYLFYMILPSLQGWAPMVAILKLVMFGSTYMALAFISTKAQASSSLNIRNIRSFMLAFCIVYLVGSVLVYPFPAISLMNAEELLRSGSVAVNLYKGMTNHSQTLGMFVCCWTAFLLGDWFLNVQKKDKLYLGLILCGVFLILKTSSRTAMGTLLVALAFLAYNMIQARGINSRWKSKVVTGITVLSIVGAAIVIAIPTARNKVTKFAMKWGGDESSATFDVEGAVSSRQGLVEYSLYLWRLKPTIGWGFQVSPEVGEMEKKSGGLLLSAPVEKGVWVTAVLEEGGVFGEIIYVIYAAFAFLMLLMKRAYMGATVFMLIHVSNMGEFTMFSMSGVGCVWYSVLFTSLVFDAMRLRGGMRPGFGLPPYGPPPVGFGLGPRIGRRLGPGPKIGKRRV